MGKSTLLNPVLVFWAFSCQARCLCNTKSRAWCIVCITKWREPLGVRRMRDIVLSSPCPQCSFDSMRSCSSEFTSLCLADWNIDNSARQKCISVQSYNRLVKERKWTMWPNTRRKLNCRYNCIEMINSAYLHADDDKRTERYCALLAYLGK